MLLGCLWRRFGAWWSLQEQELGWSLFWYEEEKERI